MLPEFGQEIRILSYKHDKSLHRIWSKATVVEANKEKIVAVTNSTVIVEGNGRRWVTKEPAICFYYPNKWYNIIAMIRKKGIFYYCNLASPSIFDIDGIKNIDYDLDVKVYPNGHYKILDEHEYFIHQQKMNYSAELKEVIEGQMNLLLDEIREKNEPFSQESVDYYYEIYQNLQ